MRTINSGDKIEIQYSAQSDFDAAEAKLQRTGSSAQILLPVSFFRDSITVTIPAAISSSLDAGDYLLSITLTKNNVVQKILKDEIRIIGKDAQTKDSLTSFDLLAHSPFLANLKNGWAFQIVSSPTVSGGQTNLKVQADIVGCRIEGTNPKREEWSGKVVSYDPFTGVIAWSPDLSAVPAVGDRFFVHRSYQDAIRSATDFVLGNLGLSISDVVFDDNLRRLILDFATAEVCAGVTTGRDDLWAYHYDRVMERALKALSAYQAKKKGTQEISAGYLGQIEMSR